jgi:uncharacterized coiled-coil DUF342 family protein
MNRQLVEYVKKMNHDITNLKAEIKKINGKLKDGENFYKKMLLEYEKKEINDRFKRGENLYKTTLLKQKKSVNNLRNKRNRFNNDLKKLIHLRSKVNKFVKENLQPSTSGRK